MEGYFDRLSMSVCYPWLLFGPTGILLRFSVQVGMSNPDDYHTFEDPMTLGPV